MQIRNPKSDSCCAAKRCFAEQEIRIRAFTVIELLVVVAIIALLMAILVPAIVMGRKAGEASATRSLLQGVSTGLVSYNRDHNGFPPSKISATTGKSFGLDNGSTLSGWKGSELVCQAMTGASGSDGETGFGWKKGGASSTGKTYGPYYETKQYELKKGPPATFNDYWDQAVQYYETKPGQNTVWGGSSARFNQGDNDDSNKVHPEDFEDESTLRSAQYILASPGPTDEIDDDIIVIGP